MLNAKQGLAAGPGRRHFWSPRGRWLVSGDELIMTRSCPMRWWAIRGCWPGRRPTLRPQALSAERGAGAKAPPSPSALPLSLIAGIYGMNFTNIPELGFRYGYETILGVMIAIAVVALLYFYHQGWFR